MNAMRRWCRSAVLTTSVVLLAGCSAAGNDGIEADGTGTNGANANAAERVASQQADLEADIRAIAAVKEVAYTDYCGAAAVGEMRCFAKRVIQPNGVLSPDANPSGLAPADIKSAYALPSTGGNGKTVAIVDAYDAPNAESDLAKYRAQYGLPACTTANGCFKKVNQQGQASNYPTANSGWAGEIALDLDMVSAACPDCKILLVEADSANNPDLGDSVNMAVSLGAVAVSNSYGGGESSTDAQDGTQYYKHPGVLITVSSGDNGYGAQFPASSPWVMAVGGTRLAKSSSTRGWAETAWTSGGSGCSKYQTKPTYQTDTGCTKRTVADVAAVGDPATGVAVYNGGWEVVGGTSASSPLIAAIFTLLNLNAADDSYPYAHTTAFFDVTSGTNGSCGGTYLCKAGVGYDGPTGVGTPNGAVLAGSPVNVDAGTPTPDAGVPVVDAGHPPVDAGHPPVDSGTPVVDSGSPSTDSGSPSTDSGVTPTTDAGSPTPPVDAGVPTSPTPKSDAGTVHDAGSKGTDSGAATNSDTFDSSSPSGCGCKTAGSSSPLGSRGSSLLAIGAVIAFAARRRRRAIAA